MNENQRLQLQDMIKANDVKDQTELIRSLKHSELLKNDINTMLLFKSKYKDDIEKLNEVCMNECSFLFTNYTDIYNKVKKDEIDLKMLFEFIKILRKIEDGELDQHEGSFMVGTLLKEIYIDSALKKSEKLDELYEKEKQPHREKMNISWKQFKKMK